MWEFDCEESWALKNWCFWTVVLEKTLESPLDCKEIQPVHPKEDQSWCSLEGLMLKLKLILWPPHGEELAHWKRPWCWEGLGTGGEGNDRGWDDWMASPTRWTWVWVNAGSWWWTGRPGVLLFMGSQRVGHVWATALNWTEHWSNHFTQALSLCGHSVLSALCVLSRVRLFETLWTVARQATLFIGFFRQEYWSRLPFPPPRQLYKYYYHFCLQMWKARHRRLGCLPQITQLENDRASICIQEVQGNLWEHMCGRVSGVTISKLGSVVGL